MSGQYKNSVLDVLATDPFTNLPVHIECMEVSTPDLVVKTHFKLLCRTGCVHKIEVESIRRLIRTIKTFHAHGHTGVLMGFITESNKEEWLPLVDANSPEAEVYIASFAKFTKGLLPYSPEDCLDKVNAIKGAAE